MAKTNTAAARELYARFFDAFESMGEPNVPIDKQIMQSDEFYALLTRLRSYAAQHHRDHWVQCRCGGGGGVSGREWDGCRGRGRGDGAS